MDLHNLRHPIIPPGMPPPPPELLEFKMKNYKVNWCRNIRDGQNCCWYGPKCHFAHHPFEQREEGYGPTPEEAAACKVKLPQELIDWWKQARATYKHPQSQHRSVSHSGATNLHAATDEEDDELRMLREQFPEEFQAMCSREQQEQWQEVAAPKRHSAPGYAPDTDNHPHEQPHHSAASAAHKNHHAAHHHAAQHHNTTHVTPPAKAKHQRKHATPAPTNGHDPDTHLSPATPSTHEYTPVSGFMAATPVAPSTSIQQLNSELHAVSDDLRAFLALPDPTAPAHAAHWAQLSQTVVRYRRRAVEMVDRIEALGAAVDALGDSSSPGTREEVAQLMVTRDKAEHEYLSLTPAFSEMNRLYKEIRQLIKSAAATEAPAASVPATTAAAVTTSYSEAFASAPTLAAYTAGDAHAVLYGMTEVVATLQSQGRSK